MVLQCIIFPFRRSRVRACGCWFVSGSIGVFDDQEEVERVLGGNHVEPRGHPRRLILPIRKHFHLLRKGGSLDGKITGRNWKPLLIEKHKGLRVRGFLIPRFGGVFALRKSPSVIRRADPERLGVA